MKLGRFYTALREPDQRQLERLGQVDIVVGIPCYYSAESVAYVIETVARGLEEFYPDRRALILVSDGGSTDDTREVAEAVEVTAFNVKKMVSIYRGLPGKGTAFRLIFEAAAFLNAKGLALFDSDLKSITPEWVEHILTPVLEQEYDFVAPDYKRYKFDGTITNTITYNLTRALYGVKIRQPIGGDFGVSPALVKFYLTQDIWDSDVAKFGIDIWMTTRAIVNNFKICQARLGVKVHGEKDPAEDLSPMFYQVVGTIFQMMEMDVEFWMSQPELREVPTYGKYVGSEPPAFEVSKAPLIEYFKTGFSNFGALWREHLAPEEYEAVAALAASEDEESFYLDPKTWVRIVYRYAWIFHNTDRQRRKIVSTLIPIYNARVASLMTALGDPATDAEAYFEKQAQIFEQQRPWLVELWHSQPEEA